MLMLWLRSLKAYQSIYATRDMKKTFIERYTDVPNCRTMVLRNIFHEHTQDCSAAASSKEAEIDDRVVNFYSRQMIQTLFWI